MLRTIVLLAAVLVASDASVNAASLYPSTTPSENHPFRQLTGTDLDTCANPCWINKTILGADLEVMRLAVFEAEVADKDIVINAPCLSGCTDFAIYAWAYVWITRNALFGFHLTQVRPLFSGQMVDGDVVWKTKAPSEPLAYLKPEHPQMFADWVKQHGPSSNDGYPKKPVLLMSAAEAIDGKFWREWPGKQ